MGGGGDPDRARPDAGRQRLQPRGIGGRRLHVVFEIADGVDARRAELHQAGGVVLALGEADVDAAQQRRDETRREPPARERTLRQPRVDGGDGNCPRMDGADHVRPDFRFGQQEQVGPPMVEEALDEGAGRRAGTYWWKAPSGRRCARMRAEVTVPVVTSTWKPLALSRSTSGSSASPSPTLAPWSQASRPSGRAQTRPAAPLAQPRQVFLAAPRAAAQEQAAERREPFGGGAIDGQKHLRFHRVRFTSPLARRMPPVVRFASVMTGSGASDHARAAGPSIYRKGPPKASGRSYAPVVAKSCCEGPRAHPSEGSSTRCRWTMK